jgi:ABC-type Na+ efflux pump, permease component
MNLRVRAVLRKELREFRRNKFVVGSMIVLPLVFIVIPIGNIVSLKAGTSEEAIKSVLGGASLTFFLVPLLLPSVIAGYAVVGEREQGTLEPVLSTPLRERELVIGKALAAIVPSVVIAYVLFAAYVIVISAFAIPEVSNLVRQSSQLLAVILFAPLLSTFAIWVGLAISVRSSDIRVAQQLSALAMLPMLGLLALFTFRVVAPSISVAVIGAVLLLAFDAVAWRVVSAMFDRERMLTRYGGN